MTCLGQVHRSVTNQSSRSKEEKCQ